MTSPIAPGKAFLPRPEMRDGVSPTKVLPQIDKSKVDPKLLSAAQGMEAQFLDYMYQVMRQTVPKNDMDLESPATKIYQGMMDYETAQKAARAGGVGLADQIVAYLESQRYNLDRGPGGAPGADHRMAPTRIDPTVNTNRPTGGTHEGQPDRQ